MLGQLQQRSLPGEGVHLALVAGGLLYGGLAFLVLQPLRRVTRSIEHFALNPEAEGDPPSDRHDEPPTLEDAAKYHAVRALALYCDDVDHPGWTERLMLALAERSVAWHVAALHKGMSGQAALDWVRDTDEPNARLIESTLPRVHFKVGEA